MNEAKRTEALRLAKLLDQHLFGNDYVPHAAAELRRQDARIAELKVENASLRAQCQPLTDEQIEGDGNE